MSYEDQVSLWPGITAGEARAAGEDVDVLVPDDATLLVERMEVVDAVRVDGRTVVSHRLVGARWCWDEDRALN